mgnify:FL=1
MDAVFINAYVIAGDATSGQQITDVMRGHLNFSSALHLGDSEPMRGPLWVFVATITNGAGGAGSHFYDVEVGAGGELELLGGLIVNGDTVGVTFNVRITDGTDTDGAAPAQTDIIMELVPVAVSLAAAASRSFPTANASADNGPGAPFPVLIRGTMKLKVNTGSVALSQDTQLSLWGRIRNSDYPAVTLNGASTPVLTVVTNAVF